MGRKSKYREFLTTLSEVTGLTGAAFAHATGKKPQNMSQYLSGTKTPGKNTAIAAVRHLRETWAVSPVLELDPVPKPLTTLPTAGGIYALYGSSGETLYVGQATNLRAEISQTLNRKVNFPLRRGPNLSKKARPKFRDVTARLSTYEVN